VYGTPAAAVLDLIEQSGLAVETASDLAEAADRVVAAARGAGVA
jgi:hypothetical protein